METKAFNMENTKTEESLPAEHFLKKAIENASEDKDRAPVQIWDFGGQSVFYTTHQTFLSIRCIYLLVFDVSKSLHEFGDDIDLVPGQITEHKHLEFLFFWVNSIITYAGTNNMGFPKIIFVGTHLDEVPEDERRERVNQLFTEIEEQFLDHFGFDHLIIDSRHCFNTLDLESEEYDVLRQHILEIAESQPFWGEKRPTAWLSLEETLTKLRNGGTHYLSLQQIKLLNENSSVHVMAANELEAFLNFQHCRGNILFFPENSLRDFVILNPVWLIDALKSFITAKTFCIAEDVREEMWRGTTTNGTLEKKVINEIWGDPKYKEFHDNKDSILKIMERLDLITIPKEYSADGDNISLDYYLVPSMILNHVSSEDIAKIIPSSRSVCWLLSSKRRFLPPAVFHRVITSCLVLWPLLRHKNKNMLYSGFCGLRLDNFHRLFLQQKKFQLLINVSHSRGVRAINQNLCKVIADYIMTTINTITEVYNQYFSDTEKRTLDKSARYDIFDIQIPCCSDHLDCMITGNSESQQCSHHEVNHQHTLFACLQKTDDFHKEIVNSCESACNGLGKTVLKRKPTDQDMSRLSRYLVSPPDILGTALDLPADIIDYIISRPYSDKREQNFCLLHCWNDSQKTNFQTLLEALSASQDNNAHILCKMHAFQQYEDISDALGEMYFRQPSLEHLDYVANRLTPSQAFHLGIELGLTLAEIEQIRYDNANNSLRQFRELLYRWRGTYKFPETSLLAAKPTYGNLSEALYQIGAPSSIFRDLFNTHTEDDEI